MQEILALLGSVGLWFMNSHCLAWSVYSECFKVLQGRAEIVKDAEFIFSYLLRGIAVSLHALISKSFCQ